MNPEQGTRTDELEVERDGERPIRFAGKLIAKASSREHSGPQNTRWTEIRIYRTARGKYVVAIVDRTIWQGETDRHSAHICASHEEVIAALTQDGYLSRVAKAAMEQAGVDIAEIVD